MEQDKICNRYAYSLNKKWAKTIDLYFLTYAFWKNT